MARKPWIACARYKGEAEKAARDGVPSRLRLSARLYLSSGAAEGTEFQLSAAACHLPRVQDSVPQPGDPADDLAPSMVAARTVLGTGHTTFNLPMILV